MRYTEAEQNRLIVTHMPLVERVASRFRGEKGIPFEDLKSEGCVGLVQAGRIFDGRGDFAQFAGERIGWAIQDFIRKWEVFDNKGDPFADKDFYEWQNFMATPYECWTSLDATPEELLLKFEQLGSDRQALSSAMIGLSERERRMIHARFFREPRQTLNSIAREHKVSYARTVFLINRALLRMAHVIEAIQNKKRKRSSLAAAPRAVPL